jgi:hypothetical protein
MAMMTAEQLIESLKQIKKCFDIASKCLPEMDLKSYNKASTEIDMRISNILMALKIDTSGDLKKDVVSLLKGTEIDAFLQHELTVNIPPWEIVKERTPGIDDLPESVQEAMEKFIVLRRSFNEIAQKLQ